ncbi:MAG: metallophosphoesterase [Leptospiraceae bacterium]|nr:metallophosphoesterase [Leptospiraceae bacterium]
MFRVVVGIAAAVLLFFHLFLFRRHKKRWGDRSWFALFRIFYWSLAIPAIAYLLLALFMGRSLFTIPAEGVWGAFYHLQAAMNYPHIFFFPFYFMLLLIIHLFLIWPSRIKSKIKTQSKTALSRRDFLAKSTSAVLTTLDTFPLGVSLFSLGGMFLGSRDILVEKIQIRIANLPSNFEGLRLVQISDIHIGNLIHENYLKAAAQIIKGVKGDLLLVTGDIIDNNNYFLPVAARFFASLKEAFPMGMYGVLGNHDFIMDGEEVATQLTGAGLRMLRNETLWLGRGRQTINLMGLDFPPVPRASHHRRIKYMQKFFAQAKKSVKEGYPTILLNHHPSDFEVLKNEDVDLVLSGHTHGGQFMFSQNRESPLALASNWYRYYIGHYEENGRQLYVNRGLGHWFPLRINCPTEITVIELTS